MERPPPLNGMHAKFIAANSACDIPDVQPVSHLVLQCLAIDVECCKQVSTFLKKQKRLDDMHQDASFVTPALMND